MKLVGAQEFRKYSRSKEGRTSMGHWKVWWSNLKQMGVTKISRMLHRYCVINKCTLYNIKGKEVKISWIYKVQMMKSCTSFHRLYQKCYKKIQKPKNKSCQTRAFTRIGWNCSSISRYTLCGYELVKGCNYLNECARILNPYYFCMFNNHSMGSHDN